MVGGRGLVPLGPWWDAPQRAVGPPGRANHGYACLHLVTGVAGCPVRLPLPYHLQVAVSRTVPGPPRAVPVSHFTAGD